MPAARSCSIQRVRMRINSRLSCQQTRAFRVSGLASGRRHYDADQENTVARVSSPKLSYDYENKSNYMREVGPRGGERADYETASYSGRFGKKAGLFTRSETREMPRLRLDHLVFENPQRTSGEQSAPPKRSLTSWDRVGSEMAIMTLTGLSPSMDESDFRRLEPRGKHIEGWTHDLGRIIQVIPARDDNTYERTGRYFLIFSSQASAVSYQESITHYRKLSKTYRPRNFDSPIPSPPGYAITEQDAQALAATFALVLPSSSLFCKILTEPFGPFFEDIVKHGGYEPLCRNGSRPGKSVLLHAEGTFINHVAILEAIQLDGEDRGWPWDTVSKNPVQKLEHAHPSTGAIAPSVTAIVDIVSMNRRRSRWLVDFKSSSEAKRFAREWHRKRLPMRSSGPDANHEAPLMTTDLIW